MTVRHEAFSRLHVASEPEQVEDLMVTVVSPDKVFQCVPNRDKYRQKSHMSHDHSENLDHKSRQCTCSFLYHWHCDFFFSSWSSTKRRPSSACATMRSCSDGWSSSLWRGRWRENVPTPPRWSTPGKGDPAAPHPPPLLSLLIVFSLWGRKKTQRANDNNNNLLPQQHLDIFGPVRNSHGRRVRMQKTKKFNHVTNHLSLVAYHAWTL